MGLETEDTFVARLQDILRIAHDLKEIIVVSNAYCLSSTRTCDSCFIIDPVNLPSPHPLLPSLLGAGVSPEIASAASQIYQRRAEQLKQDIQGSLATACRRMVAELPIHSSALAPDLLMKRLASIFTSVYLSRLTKWKEEVIQRTKQASESHTKTATRNYRTFNQDYVPLLEHFFEENPFPTHADKMFLAQKSNMEYRQIHVWFQNRRNRTKREGKTLRKKLTHEGATKPLDKLCQRMKCHLVDSQHKALKCLQPKAIDRIKLTQNNVLKDAFISPPPPHAFPSPYPPTCQYNPFPCKGGSACFDRPEWRRVSERPPLSVSTTVDDLVKQFSRLSVRDGMRSKGSPESQSHAATAAITVTPSCAPHPSLIVREYTQPANTVQLCPPIRAPPSCSKAFQIPDPDSAPLTLVPLSTPPNKSEPSKKRKIAPLPQRFPDRMQNACRDTTPSEYFSTFSASPRLFTIDTESRSCSFSSINSLSSTPSDVANARELPHLLGSPPCRSPLASPIHHQDATPISSASVS